MAFDPTVQQKKAIDARGTVLVSAAAGSGKTAVLSQRVVSRITDSVSPVDINDMLIVTFTNAASGEMRERISKLLSEKAENDPTNHRLLKQKMAVDSASIGTIDSFCIDLVRDNFAEAGVDPDFRIATNEQLDIMSGEAVAEAFDKLSDSDYDRYCDLLTALNCESADDGAYKAVTNIYRYISSLPMPERWLDKAVSFYDRFDGISSTEWMKVISSHVFDVTDYAYVLINNADTVMQQDGAVSDGYGDAVHYLSDTLDKIRRAADQCDYSEISGIFADYTAPSLKAVRKCEDIGIKNSVKNAIDIARKTLENLCPIFSPSAEQRERDVQAAGETVRTLVYLVREYGKIFTRLKNERGVKSFSDIEFAALNLLCDDVDGKLVIKDSAKELCSRYAEVMVDEYQDTNDLQNAIFNALSGGGERLFLVGDVKQSIYRFRQANPLNFINLRRELLRCDKTVALSGNFRSRPEICDFVNFCFELLMTGKTAEIDYGKDDRLDPMGKFAPCTDGGVELHFIDTDDADKKADYVARYIRDSVKRGDKVSDGEQLRSVNYGDFTVLLRSFKSFAPFLVRSMKRYGVPVSAELNTLFFDRPEIIMIMSLLQVIDNPLRDIPLLSVLMSPVFAFTADEIAEMRAPDKKCSLYSSLLAYASENAKAADFLARISKYRSWAGTMPTDRLISRIYDDTGMTAIARSMEDGATKRANLLMLIEYAADYESSGCCDGLTSFMRYTELIKQRGTELSGASATESDDAVRIMSIHKSKGLQSPVCIVAELESKFNMVDSRASLIMHEHYGIGISVCDRERAIRYDTLPRRAIEYKETESTVAEEMRLLYVAMTRAQDRLVLVTADKNLDKHIAEKATAVSAGYLSADDPLDAVPVRGARSMSDWIMMCALLHESCEKLRCMAGSPLAVKPSEYPVKLVFGDLTDGLDEDADTADRQTDYDFSPMLDYVYPYEKLLNIESKYSVSALAKSIYQKGEKLTARPAFITGDTMTAAEKGTATHRFMCYAEYANAEKDIDTEALTLVEQGKLTKEQADGLDREAISSFFESDIYRQMLGADRVLRESRFIFEVPARQVDAVCDSDEPVVVQGVADCILFDPDGITVVDFKTDRNTTEQTLTEKYTRQLELYAKAFSSNYKMPVKRCVLYSFWLRKTVEIPFENQL